MSKSILSTNGSGEDQTGGCEMYRIAQSVGPTEGQGHVTPVHRYGPHSGQTS